MLRRLIRSRWFTLGITALALCAWGIFLRSQLQTLQAYPWRVSPLALALGIASGALYFGLLALGWALLLQQIVAHTRAVRLPVAAHVWLTSMLSRYIPGNVWHLMARIALAERLQIGAGPVLLSGVVEQCLTLLGAAVLSGLMLPFWRLADSYQTWLWLVLPAVLLLHPRVFGTLLRELARRLRRPALVWNYTLADLLRLLGVYVGAMTVMGSALGCVLWGLTDVSLAQTPVIWGSAALAYLVGYLSFLTPSGLGVREAVLTALLAQVFPLPVAVGASLLFRVVLTLGEMLMVLIAWSARRYQHFVRKDHGYSHA